MPKFRLKLPVVAGLAVLAIIVIAVVLMSGPPGKMGPSGADGGEASEIAALTVTVTVPEVSNWPVEIQASGRLAAWQEAIVSAEVSGQRIVELNTDIGDQVAKGQILARLSQESIRNDILELEASLESARAQLAQASADVKRIRDLKDKQSLSEQQISEYEVTERKAQASVDSIAAQLSSKELDLARTLIVAVSDGVVSSRSAALGDVVSSGQELFRLIRDNRIEWQAEVPLPQLFSIETGMPIRIPTLKGDITGSIRQISPEASEANGRIKIYAELNKDSDGPEPKVGVMVNGVIETGESESVHVPSSAVVLQDGFSYVFILEEGEPVRVSRQRVETGRRVDDQVELLNDLPRDVRVVLSGGALLSDGSVVRVASGADQGGGQ